MGNRHVTDGSLDFGQRKDVLHQLRHFGACEIFELRGKALNRAAQIAKTVGALLSLAFLQILLSVLQTLQLVLFLCKLCLDLFLFGSELFRVFGFAIFVTSFFENGDKKRPSTFRRLRPVNGQFSVFSCCVQFGKLKLVKVVGEDIPQHFHSYHRNRCFLH